MPQSRRPAEPGGSPESSSPAPLRRLPERLRFETAELHRSVEAAVDISHAIQTRDEYISLLGRLYDLHFGLEERLEDRRWAQDWTEVGIDIGAHRRSGALAADLARLGVPATSVLIARNDPITQPAWPTFGHALGCLYVLEGSALGGRVVARLVRVAIGAVPTTFLTGDGRAHPAPWSALRAALRRFEACGGDADAVVTGARVTFGAFAHHLAQKALVE